MSYELKKIRIISAPNKNVWYNSKINQDFYAFKKKNDWWINGLLAIPIKHAREVSKLESNSNALEDGLTDAELETITAIRKKIDKNNYKPFVTRKEIIDYIGKDCSKPLSGLVSKGFLFKEKDGNIVKYCPL